MFIRYENDYFYYVRKPQGIPSTFGSEESFLHKLIGAKSEQITQLQQAWHWVDKELWLVNRLDNVTGGLLFFAKNPALHSDYKLLQQDHKVEKIYYADLYGIINYALIPSAWKLWIMNKDINSNVYTECNIDLFSNQFLIPNSEFRIKSPIYHHAIDDSKMTTDLKHARWKAHQVETIIQPIEYNKEENYTTCRIIITKGIRHQIRLHTASIWHHIIGDTLYCPKDLKTRYKGDKINLRSVGIKFNS